jgi:hypothetical protein
MLILKCNTRYSARYALFLEQTQNIVMVLTEIYFNLLLFSLSYGDYGRYVWVL